MNKKLMTFSFRFSLLFYLFWRNCTTTTTTLQRLSAPALGTRRVFFPFIFPSSPFILVGCVLYFSVYLPMAYRPTSEKRRKRKKGKQKRRKKEEPTNQPANNKEESLLISAKKESCCTIYISIMIRLPVRLSGHWLLWKDTRTRRVDRKHLDKNRESKKSQTLANVVAVWSRDPFLHIIMWHRWRFVSELFFLSGALSPLWTHTHTHLCNSWKIYAYIA